MKAYELEQGSTGLENLKLVERDEPKPGPGQVLIRIRAASLNYRDQAVMMGKYGGIIERNTIPLSDGAGEVVETGAHVNQFKTGDKVAGTFFQGWTEGKPNPDTFAALGSPLDGVLAEYIVLDEDGLVAVPEHLSYEEAACLPCAGVTAWVALMVSGRIKPGDTVLTLGTGGVSIFALQFSKMNGARVIITSASDEKLERAKALGADATVNYSKIPDWHEEVIKITGGKGADHIIELGGVGTLEKSFQALAYCGQVSLIGVLTGFEGGANPLPLMRKSGRLQGIFVGNRAAFEEMNKAMAVNGMKPIVDTVFPFEQAPEAYKYQWEKKHFGKIVISV